MSTARRRQKAASRRAEADARQRGRARMEAASDAHSAKYPHCTYGREPHFVGPSFGQRGFFLCESDEAARSGVTLDLRNHTRCPLPYDHEHPEHHGPDMVAVILKARADVKAAGE